MTRVKEAMSYQPRVHVTVSIQIETSESGHCAARGFFNFLRQIVCRQVPQNDQKDHIPPAHVQTNLGARRASVQQMQRWNHTYIQQVYSLAAQIITKCWFSLGDLSTNGFCRSVCLWECAQWQVGITKLVNVCAKQRAPLNSIVCSFVRPPAVADISKNSLLTLYLFLDWGSDRSRIESFCRMICWHLEALPSNRNAAWKTPSVETCYCKNL